MVLRDPQRTETMSLNKGLAFRDKGETSSSKAAAGGTEAKPAAQRAIISSVQFSRSVLSDSLRPHEPQHARPPCPSQTPGAYSNSCRVVDDAIRPPHPAVPFSSRFGHLTQRGDSLEKTLTLGGIGGRRRRGRQRMRYYLLFASHCLSTSSKYEGILH